ncbi:hypothetical protein A2617_01615 [Candidatus Daviesbacteria bacterium RIFOXYD1_FULL_41_10]|uniref:Uncharacterized protein n=2 Tax=Candidatus Daviesiibacteriota TaxID=1752718 RepID=A0A1F5MZM5_9BACT|nr:MAG: hypothetical protein UU67_C0022G0022 [Candidatus Daviesbacteria bacterium GW2011_GWB1_41_5]OGE70763.1 MAG: hypothetical protein A2617_01615 [Candidatus Daviesbacteria bacterium RIFOXYD1_FULL_41_10]
MAERLTTFEIPARYENLDVSDLECRRDELWGEIYDGCSGLSFSDPTLGELALQTEQNIAYLELKAVLVVKGGRQRAADYLNAVVIDPLRESLAKINGIGGIPDASTSRLLGRVPRDGEILGGPVRIGFNQDGQRIDGLSPMYPCPWR